MAQDSLTRPFDQQVGSRDFVPPHLHKQIATNN